MKHHIMLALGILMLLIFAWQGLQAVMAPGWGLKEAYVAGGLILASWLIRSGLAEWKHARSQKSPRP